MSDAAAPSAPVLSSEGEAPGDVNPFAPADAAAPATLNPFEPGFFDDPYSRYRRLREAEPVHRTAFGAWLVTRWADVHRILRNPTTSVQEENATLAMRRDNLAEIAPERAERGRRAILNIDPPDHTRLRRLVSKAFTPRAVERMREQVIAQTEALLDDVAARGGDRMDVIADLAFPLPFAVISEMLGMPDQDREQLREWSHMLTLALDPILAIAKTEEIFEASDRMTELVTEVVQWKRGRPDDDDLLQALICADDGGDVLTDRELLDNVILLYVAGHETTVNLIGNGTLALLRDPDQRRRLIDDPSLDANATDELLRYDSPVQFSRRIALQPIEIGGHTVQPGELVMTGLGAANRDPDKFGATVDRLDLGRTDANQHVSFGSGVHHCLGAALARLEGSVAIPRLARRFPDMELAEEPAWNGRLILRGLDALEVTC
ncbi:MAG: cytochrome P450 [Actinobacteria bacterium]|nr:cytochrome P450 [Actinomycetota bacterium]